MTRQEATQYINSAPTSEERMKRKAQVHHILYSTKTTPKKVIEPDEEINKLIQKEVYKTICLFAEYASRMKEEDTLHDVLRKLKWKLKQEK